MTVSPQNPAQELFDRDPFDAFDPLDQEAYEREVRELVRDTAPRLFAVVVEYRAGTADADAVVAAWGIAHEDGKAEVSGAEVGDGGCGRRWSLASAEGALRHFGRAEGCSARLVWLMAADVDRRTPARDA
ncbi:hypothetical protein [Streptomyces sp. NRRL F-5135]|uniref:hypothetical protein n=1 Tax=Streptomyces sp. NRRL F-5135 TaxID=1463858 RepID=UPI00068BD533|nr:hypothetical protein [Streptomyces sp. NRRL F-5135]